MKNWLSVLFVTLPLSVGAQTFDKRQLEAQFQITCSSEAQRLTPALRPMCTQMRSQLDAMKSLDEASDSEPSSMSSGMKTPSVYERMCVLQPAITAQQRSDCQKLEAAERRRESQSSSSGANPQGRSSRSFGTSGGGTPVDERGQNCITAESAKESRSGDSRTVDYMFRNGCNRTMEIRVVWNRTDGRPDAGIHFINPGKTSSVHCMQFYGKGCVSMEGYSVKVGPD